MPLQPDWPQSQSLKEEDDTVLAQQLDAVNNQLSLSLLHQEEQKRASLKREEVKHREVSGKVKSKYAQTSQRHQQLIRQVGTVLEG